MANFPNIDSKFDAVLSARKVPSEQWNDYKKWVRFYLHFCEKYRHDPKDSQTLPQFIEKLASKNQSAAQQMQAQKSIRMLFACSNSRSPGTRADTKFYPSRARISVALVRRS